MKNIPKYKKTVKFAAKAAVNDFEAAMRKKWEEDDETLNDGDWGQKNEEDDCDGFNG